MDFEAQPQRIVAGRGRSRQLAEVLGRGGRGVGVRRGARGRIESVDDLHVGVVAVLLDQDAVPIAGRGDGGGVVDGIVLGIAAEVESGADGIVVQRGKDHGVAGLADDLHFAADAIGGVQGPPGGRKARIRAEEFHDQAGVVAALQAQAAVGVQVGNGDVAFHDVNDVGIVPDRLRGEHAGADQHAVEAVVLQNVAAHQGAEIAVVLREGIERARGPAPIVDQVGVERIDVDADHGRAVAGHAVRGRAAIDVVVQERIVDDHGLGAQDIDRGLAVAAPAVAVRIGGLAAR